MMQAKNYAARRRTARSTERLIGLAMQLAQKRNLRAALQASQLAERILRLEKAARLRRAENDRLAALASARAPEGVAAAPRAAPPARLTDAVLRSTIGMDQDTFEESLIPPDILARIRAMRAASERP